MENIQEDLNVSDEQDTELLEAITSSVDKDAPNIKVISGELHDDNPPSNEGDHLLMDSIDDVDQIDNQKEIKNISVETENDGVMDTALGDEKSLDINEEEKFVESAMEEESSHQSLEQHLETMQAESIDKSSDKVDKTITSSQPTADKGMDLDVLTSDTDATNIDQGLLEDQEVSSSSNNANDEQSAISDKIVNENKEKILHSPMTTDSCVAAEIGPTLTDSLPTLTDQEDGVLSMVPSEILASNVSVLESANVNVKSPLQEESLKVPQEEPKEEISDEPEGGFLGETQRELPKEPLGKIFKESQGKLTDDPQEEVLEESQGELPDKSREGILLELPGEHPEEAQGDLTAEPQKDLLPEETQGELPEKSQGVLSKKAQVQGESNEGVQREDNLEEPLEEHLNAPLKQSLEEHEDDLEVPLEENLEEPMEENLEEPLEENLEEPEEDNLEDPQEENLEEPLDDNLGDPQEENIDESLVEPPLVKGAGSLSEPASIIEPLLSTSRQDENEFLQAHLESSAPFADDSQDPETVSDLGLLKKHDEPMHVDDIPEEPMLLASMPSLAPITETASIVYTRPNLKKPGTNISLQSGILKERTQLLLKDISTHSEGHSMLKDILPQSEGQQILQIPHQGSTIFIHGSTPVLTQMKQLDQAIAHIPKKDSENDDLATLANAALGDQAANGVKIIEEPLRKEPIWCDVGIIRGTSCHVTSYYEPSFSHDQEHENITTDSLPDYTNSFKVELEPGTAYKFRVCAVNSCGRGPWSEVSAFKTCLPGYPGAPSSIKISKSTEGAHLSWEPPSNPAGTIIEYSVCLAVRNPPQGHIDPKNQQLAFVRVYSGPHNQTVVPNSSLAAAHIDTTSKPAIIFRIAAKNEKGFGPATQVRWLQDVVASATGGVKPMPKKEILGTGVPVKRTRLEDF